MVEFWKKLNFLRTSVKSKKIKKFILMQNLTIGNLVFSDSPLFLALFTNYWSKSEKNVILTLFEKKRKSRFFFEKLKKNWALLVIHFF